MQARLQTVLEEPAVRPDSRFKRQGDVLLQALNLQHQQVNEELCELKSRNSSLEAYSKSLEEEREDLRQSLDSISGAYSQKIKHLKQNIEDAEATVTAVTQRLSREMARSDFARPHTGEGPSEAPTASRSHASGSSRP